MFPFLLLLETEGLLSYPPKVSALRGSPDPEPSSGWQDALPKWVKIKFWRFSAGEEKNMSCKQPCLCSNTSYHTTEFKKTFQPSSPLKVQAVWEMSCSTDEFSFVSSSAWQALHIKMSSSLIASLIIKPRVFLFSLFFFLNRNYVWAYFLSKHTIFR